MSGASGKTEFGELLRQRRLEAGLSQEALAERAGLSADAIRALERGRRSAPRADTIARLAEALSLDHSARHALVAAAESTLTMPPSGPGERAGETAFEVRQSLPAGDFLGSLPSGPLVGRVAESTALARFVETLAQGKGHLILLSGEAGVGKTRLAQEVTRAAHERGILVAIGRCHEEDQPAPYAPFLQVFATVYEAAPTPLQQQAAARWPYLGVLLPNHLPAPPMAGGSDEQYRVLLATTAFLQSVARCIPVAILLDDLHCADSASLRLLAHLTRQIPSSPILTVGTYREFAVDRGHPLTALLRDLSRDGLLERLSIGGLACSETRTLMASIAGEEPADRLVERIHRRTNGNPFFVQQVTRQIIERSTDRPLADVTEAIEVEVPELVSLVIEQRVRRLGDRTQDLLPQASVLGQSFSVDDLDAMGMCSGEEIDEGLDEAERSGLIAEIGRGTYRFQHALTRDALYRQLSSRRRRRLHRLAGEAITRRPERQWEPRVAEIAWHFLQSDEPARAIPYALAAGDRAEAAFVHDEAERHYRTALGLAEEIGDEGQRAEAQEKLAGPLHRSSRYEEALAALEAAAAIYQRRQDYPRLLPIMAEILGVHGNRGTPDEGLARLMPLLPHFETMPPSPGLVYLYAALASLHFVLGQVAEQFAVAQRAVQVADGLNDERALAIAKEQLGLALLSLRRRAEARSVLEEAMALAEAAGDLATFGLALNNAAYAAEVRGEIEASSALFARGLELAQQLGNPAQAAFMSYALSRTYLEIGDMRRAQEYAEQAVRMSRAIGVSWVAPYPLIGLGRVFLAIGDPRTEETLLQGLALAEHNDDRQALDIAHCSLAEVALQVGNPQRAWERLQAANVGADWDPADVGVSLATALVLAQTLFALRRLSLARKVVEAVIEEARHAEEMLVLADALPLQAMLRAEMSDWLGAEAALEEAERLSRSMGYARAGDRARYSAALIGHLVTERDCGRGELAEP